VVAAGAPAGQGGVGARRRRPRPRRPGSPMDVAPQLADGCCLKSGADG